MQVSRAGDPYPCRVTTISMATAVRRAITHHRLSRITMILMPNLNKAGMLILVRTHQRSVDKVSTRMGSNNLLTTLLHLLHPSPTKHSQRSPKRDMVTNHNITLRNPIHGRARQLLRPGRILLVRLRLRGSHTLRVWVLGTRLLEGDMISGSITICRVMGCRRGCRTVCCRANKSATMYLDSGIAFRGSASLMLYTHP